MIVEVGKYYRAEFVNDGKDFFYKCVSYDPVSDDYTADGFFKQDMNVAGTSHKTRRITYFLDQNGSNFVANIKTHEEIDETRFKNESK